jgi:penicillin-binding protein 2
VRLYTLLGALALLSLASESASISVPPLKVALQSAAARALGTRPGTVVVVDVQTGQLLAARKLEVAARRLVLPGSAVKPFTMLALLQAGAVHSDTMLMCRRKLRLAGRELDCAHVQTATSLDPVAALAYSCNSFFAQAAAQLSNRQLQSSLVHAGFASRTGLVSDEAIGTVGLSSSLEQLQLQALGEGDVHITPLELLAAYRSLAAQKGSADESTRVVLAGLEAAANYGTARLAQPGGLKIAGKTGTSSASPHEGQWTHAWFAGYAPADEPKIALVVFLERGHGGGDAAVAARKVFSAYRDSKKGSM